MLSRRFFGSALLAGLAAPSLLTAQSTPETLRDAVAGMDQLQALVVQRGEEVVLAAAPRGPGLERMANIKSCSKSLLALVLGAVLFEDRVPGLLQAKLGDLAPGLIPDDATEGVAEATLEQLVTLRLGLQGTSGANYGAWVGSGNWISYALRQPRIAPAGGRMIYSTGTTHVLGAVLAKVTGQSLLTLMRDRIGRPLAIEIPGWTRDPQGYYFGGNEMALTPQAMLRVAVMVRDGGVFEGAQVIDRQWIEDSQMPRTRSPYSGLSYGLGWFLSDSGWVIARGYGGQIIAAHPERGLAVAITSDPTQPARSEGYFGALMDLLEGPVLALA